MLLRETKNVWIGLNKLDGSWNFTDGSDYDFIPCDEDFSELKKEKCARLSPHLKDINCDKEYRYLCSYRKFMSMNLWHSFFTLVRCGKEHIFS